MMKKIVYPVVAMLLFLASCKLTDRGPQMISINGIVFGTYYSIIYYDDEGRVFQASIDSLFRDFNSSLSFYDKESLLSRINRNETDRVDDYFRVVFERAREISVETNGAFDATVFPLVNAWGFGFSKREEITPELIDSLLSFVDYDMVRLEEGRVVKDDERVQLDFNAIAKGYAADVVGMFLEAKGVEVYLVEIGGDLVARGVKPDGTPWRIGLEVPAADATAEQQWEYFVEIKDTGLATSGDYRRYHEIDGQKYSHTINPKTGYPVQHHLMSASVFAPDGMSADAYATALMVMGLDAAIRFVEDREDLEAYLIYAENDTFGYYASSGLHLLTRDDL
ncbi:MAG: FAD:protein FMN transferase [Bacteroidales bacterium]|nr:FAD:protein FMN transferase [Bacteroidales bacterium]